MVQWLYDKRESENDMRPVNLYLLTRNQNKNTYTPFENILSARHERVPVKEHEFQSLRHLVDILWQQGVAIPEMDGFFYSYTCLLYTSDAADD